MKMTFKVDEYCYTAYCETQGSLQPTNKAWTNCPLKFGYQSHEDLAHTRVNQIGTCPQKEQYEAITLYWKHSVNRRKYCIYCVNFLPLYLAAVKWGMMGWMRCVEVGNAMFVQG